MTDITTNTPGTRGHTRSTWRDENNLRGMLLRLREQHPHAIRRELEALYMVEYLQNDAFIEEAGHRVFANDYLSMQQQQQEQHEHEQEQSAQQPEQPTQQPQQPARRNRRQQRVSISDAEIAAANQRLEAIVRLDLKMPNGKKLGDCTGIEAGEFGGWLIKIRDRVGAAIIRDVLSEADVISLESSAG